VVVLDKVQSEVLPIYSYFGVSLASSCPFHKDSLEVVREKIGAYAGYRVTGGKSECPKCKKTFKNSDFLELHMDLTHFSNEKAKSFRETENKDDISWLKE